MAVWKPAVRRFVTFELRGLLEAHSEAGARETRMQDERIDGSSIYYIIRSVCSCGRF